MNDKNLAEEVVRIYERAQNETLSLIQSQSTEAIATPVCKWMSAAQLAEYLQLYNDKNALDYSRNTLVVKANLREQFPLPHAYIGHLFGFNRHEVEGWVWFSENAMVVNG